MCTVVYVPLGSGFFVSSNRDESPLRATERPLWHGQPGCRALYARDRQAGGTWIGLREDKSVVVVLNGGFEKHIPRPPYRMSRGLLVVHVLHAADPLTALYGTDFTGLEPFTLVLITPTTVRIYVWTGQETHVGNHPVGQPAIWSSVTLYDAAARRIRQQAFEKWYSDLTQQPNLAAALGGGAACRPQCAAPSDSAPPTIAPLLPEAAAGRPKYPHSGYLKKLFDSYPDPTDGFLMRRPIVETCSVTEILVTPTPTYRYSDLLMGKTWCYA